MALDRNILDAQIATLFADNNAGEITPQRLRDVITNILDAVPLTSEIVAGGSGLRWVQMPIDDDLDYDAELIPIGSSIVFSSSGFSTLFMLGVTRLNGLQPVNRIGINAGEAILINRVTEFEILAHVLTSPKFIP